MNLQKTGEFLKQLRKDKGLTQEQLAERFYVSSRTVSRWETGSNMPDLDTLIELADFYEVDIREIIDGERKSEITGNETKDTLKKIAEYTVQEKKRLKMIFYVVLATLLVILLVSYIIFYLANPKTIRNAVQAPFTTENLDMSEYVDLIIEKGSFGDLGKDAIHVLSFSMRDYGITPAVYIDVLYQKNHKTYRQSFQFDGSEMTVENRKLITNPDNVPYRTTLYPSLKELEWMMDTMKLDLLPKQPDILFRLTYISPDASPEGAITTNGKPVNDYVFNADGFFHDSEIVIDTPPNAYQGFRVMIDDTYYRIFFSKWLIEMETI